MHIIKTGLIKVSQDLDHKFYSLASENYAQNSELRKNLVQECN